jgi:hypothetical protein
LVKVLEDGYSLDAYLDAVVPFLLPGALVVDDRQALTMGGREAGRIYGTLMLGEQRIRQGYWVFPSNHGQSFWLIAYTTSDAEFNSLLSEFELSLLSLEETLAP